MAEFPVRSGEPFRLSRHLKLRARTLVAVHLPSAILSPEGTPLSEIVKLSNQETSVGLVQDASGGGVSSIIVELSAGDEIALTRSSEAIADDGSVGGLILFDAEPQIP